MQQIIDQISDQLVGLIKKDQEHYTPQQLLKADIPHFIVERIRLMLEDRVNEELQSPNSEWLMKDNELLQHAWQDFKSVAVGCTAVPHDKLYDTIHRTVQDIISVFVEPRKNLASYLFREADVLSFDEISHRCNQLTIYKHFGTAIPLYMQKRNLEEISKDRCDQLISNLDAKIIAGYSAEDWAAKLDNLFTLFGGKLDPVLIQLFFRDKQLENAASLFDTIDVPVTKSTFIELLSSGTSDLFAISEAPKAQVDEQEKEPEPETSLADDFAVKQQSKEPTSEEDLASAFKSEENEQALSEILGDIDEGNIIEEESSGGSNSLNALFGEETEITTPEGIESTGANEEKNEFRSSLTSLLDQAKHSYEEVISDESEDSEDEMIIEDEFVEDPIDESETEEDFEEEDEEKTIDEDQPEDDSATLASDAEDEDKPMWAQFLSQDQMDVMMATRDEKEEESLNESLNVEDDFGDTILDDQPGNEIQFEDNSEPEVSLSDYLEDDQKKWIKKIFSGKKKAYHEAVEEISYFKNWDQASKFVQNDVFAQHNADMFSEEAIDFVDALQSYFNKYKS